MDDTGNPPNIDHCPRILSLDGGGVRGLSSLLILRNIMEEIARRNDTPEALPCDYFDLIGGTGTGGLIAIMLGRLRMSIAECIDEFIDLSNKVFEVDQVLNGVIPLGDDECRFDYKKLESAIKTLVKKKLRDENAIMADTTERVPTFVVATKGLHADGPATLFRSYQCTGYNADKCAIWEAARATSAAPTFFKPIKIKIPTPGATFVDGGLTHNNPAELALSEAQRIWSTVKRFCLVSVGTGRSKSVKIVDTNSNQLDGLRSKMATLSLVWRRVATGETAITKIRKACVELASNSEPVHQRLFKVSTSKDPEKRFPYHRFNVERDMHEIELQEWKQMDAIGEHTATYMEEGEGETRRNQCVQDLMNPAPIQFILLSPSASYPPKYFLMPYEKNPHFTGRDDLLALLGNKLRDTTSKKYNHRVAIYGMGGVGKTQLAIEYVYRNQTKYHNIFWISSADQAALLSGFQDIARLTECVPNLDESSNPTDVAKSVLSWLRTRNGWLLVMDNMDDIEVALGFLPEMAKGGHTLITTRNPDHLMIPADGLQIPILGENAAIELLLLRSQIDCTEGSLDRIHATEIVKELGFLALAIEQAAAFIRSSVDGLANFLAIYRKSRIQFLGRNLPKTHPYPNSVAATFLLSFNRVNDDTHHGTQAISLLHLLAFLNPDGILIDFLRSGSQGLDDTLRQVIEDEIVFHDALELLQRYSLVALSQKRDNIVIHRLVQAVIKDHLDETQLRTYRENVLSICDLIFPDVDDTLTMAVRMECRKLQNQVLEPAVEAEGFSETDSSFLLYKIGKFLFQDGKFRDSERVFGLCVDLSTKRASEDHEDTLTAMSWLAEALRYSGKWDQAAAMEEKVLEAKKRILGDEHVHTLISMGNLAVTLKKQGKVDQAAAIEEKVLEAKKRILEDEHPSTLITMGNIASTLWHQGKVDQAAAMEEKVIAVMKRILGERHPDTLTTMGNLAQSYSSLGRRLEAIQLLQEAIDGSRNVERIIRILAVGWPF